MFCFHWSFPTLLKWQLFGLGVVMLEQTEAQSFRFSGDLFPVVAPVQWETGFYF